MGCGKVAKPLRMGDYAAAKICFAVARHVSFAPSELDNPNPFSHGFFPGALFFRGFRGWARFSKVVQEESCARDMLDSQSQ
jgi:hypothetical protein